MHIMLGLKEESLFLHYGICMSGRSMNYCSLMLFEISWLRKQMEVSQISQFCA